MQIEITRFTKLLKLQWILFDGFDNVLTHPSANPENCHEKHSIGHLQVLPGSDKAFD